MKIGRSIIMEDRLLYQAVYFGNKITFLKQFSRKKSYDIGGNMSKYLMRLWVLSQNL